MGMGGEVRRGASQRGFGELTICSADLHGTYQMNPLCTSSSTMSSGSVHVYNCLPYFSNKCFPQGNNMQKMVGSWSTESS